ncbi:MAG: 1-deoxy-D-xylulose-5-phosphate reductoisomerase [Firmicutes bacterium]|nr:1-deoxy-D-xylulose-5-phosphate reductoisomerase [Bacillota bacterium]
MKKLAVLGSTGSIGAQTLDIVKAHPEKFQVTALSCGKNIKLLAEQIVTYRPVIAVCGRQEDVPELKEMVKAMDREACNQTEILWGQEGLKTVAIHSDCQMILNALMGISGLVPTMAAIEAGKDIALANKETLVTGGHMVMEAARRQGVKILPVDSEHSAIFQCLEGNQNRPIKRILLTASGGPFRGFTREQLEQVTLEQALKHPKWNMGRKITIDSATMMNKGLEVIEAKWLFDVPVSDIEILVHPQSIVHSMVEFMDTSVIAQLGVPDMGIPIGLALAYPNRLTAQEQQAGLDFFDAASHLTFERPDPKVFRCIDLAYQASLAGDSYPAAMNGANEVLVELFLQGKIRFIDIQDILEKVLERHQPISQPGLEEVLQVDREIREMTYLMAAATRN